MGLRNSRPAPPGVAGQAEDADAGEEEARWGRNRGRPRGGGGNDRVAEELGVIGVAQLPNCGEGRETQDPPGAVIPADQTRPAGGTATAAVEQGGAGPRCQERLRAAD